MPERDYSCNYGYGPREALEALDYVVWVLLQRPKGCRWCLPKRDLPPRGSPLRRLIRCVMKDLEELGFASKRHGICGTKRLAWYLDSRRWRLLLECKWVCTTCPHINECPLGALFRVKGWALPGEEVTAVTTEVVEA